MGKTNLVWVVFANSLDSNHYIVKRDTNLSGDTEILFNLYLEILIQCLIRHKKNEFEQPEFSIWIWDEKTVGSQDQV